MNFCNPTKTISFIAASISIFTHLSIYSLAAENILTAQLAVKGCGSAEECYNIGLQYYKGEGVVKNQTRSAQLFTKACETGYASGCFNAGYQYANGHGVAKDLTLASKFYAKSCEGNNAAGCLNAGVQFENGQGVDKDLARAAQLYVKACDATSQEVVTMLRFNISMAVAFPKIKHWEHNS